MERRADGGLGRWCRGRRHVPGDTGINYTFLSPPDSARLRRGMRAPAGTRISVFLPDRRNPPSVHYGFTVGLVDNAMHPASRSRARPRRVRDTGRMFLEGFDYLYDAVGGYVGFGWNGRLTGALGSVTPGLAR
jgi:hypothetical protein